MYNERELFVFVMVLNLMYKYVSTRSTVKMTHDWNNKYLETASFDDAIKNKKSSFPLTKFLQNARLQ